MVVVPTAPTLPAAPASSTSPRTVTVPILQSPVAPPSATPVAEAAPQQAEPAPASRSRAAAPVESRRAAPPPAPAVAASDPAPAPVADAAGGLDDALADGLVIPPVAAPVQPIASPAPQPQADSSGGGIAVLSIMIGLLVAVAVAALAFVVMRRRKAAAIRPAPIERPRPVPTRPLAPSLTERRPIISRLASVPPVAESGWTAAWAPREGQTPSRNGASVALPAVLPGTFEERDALLKRMVAAAPDRANPFRSPKARVYRARLILQSLGRKFEAAEPWIDLSQYPDIWPEPARRRLQQAA